MSVASFVAAMAPYARQVASATGLDCRLFLTQWGYESAWGTSPVSQHNNFAGIENSTGKGCTVCNGIYTCCPTIQDFTDLYIAIIEQGIYAPVRATAGRALSTQMVALGNSPWAAGHYEGSCGTPGCGLISLYNQFATTINACLSAPPACSPPCPSGFTCVAGHCVPTSPPPSGSGTKFGTVLLIVSGVAFGAAAWEHRERLGAMLSTGTGKRARRSGGFV